MPKTICNPKPVSFFEHIKHMHFSSVNDIVIVLGFIVLVWYTIETYRIRKVTVIQKDLQLLPTPMLYFHNSPGQKRIKIQNIGIGAAIGVTIEKYEFSQDSRTCKFIFNLEDGNNVLAPEEERMVGVNYFVNGEASNAPYDNFWSQFNSDGGGVSTEAKNIKIRFQDATGQHYEMNIGFSSRGVEITKPPTRVKPKT